LAHEAPLKFKKTAQAIRQGGCLLVGLELSTKRAKLLKIMSVLEINNIFLRHFLCRYGNYSTFFNTNIRITFQERKLRHKRRNGTICAVSCPFMSAECGLHFLEVPYFMLSIVDQQQPFWSG